MSWLAIAIVCGLLLRAHYELRQLRTELRLLWIHVQTKTADPESVRELADALRVMRETVEKHEADASGTQGRQYRS